MVKIRSALVLAIFGGLGVACGAQGNDPGDVTGRTSAALSQAGLAITPGGQNSCTTSNSACFTVTADSQVNITQIFVDVNACGEENCDPGFTVTADGELVALHTEGGPCNGGDDNLIERDAWFPLTQDQSTATICVCTDTPAVVSIGAKAKSECLSGPSTSECIWEPRP